MLRHSLSPELIERLIAVVESRRGHSIALGVEAAKIALSAQTCATIDLTDVERDFIIEVNRDSLQAAIADRLGALTRTLEQALAEAGLDGERIDAVFLTGGSTAIPAVRAVVTARTPRAAIVEGDLFGAVGLGLGLDARRKFG
jgi:hypothetical chaperone protein